VTRERWERITDVFRAALERPVGERAAFVENECGSDTALRRDIERLLAGEAEPSLPSPLPEFLGGSATELAPGDMLAHYRVEAKSGEGGMAEAGHQAGHLLWTAGLPAAWRSTGDNPPSARM